MKAKQKIKKVSDSFGKLIDSTSICKECGCEFPCQVYENLNSKPHVCDSCEKQKEVEALKRENPGVATLLDMLPFRDWDPKLALPAPYKKIFQAVLANPSLYIHGDTGVGKSRITCRIAEQLIMRGKRIRWYAAQDIQREYSAQFSNGVSSANQYLKSISAYPNLTIIDDFGKGKATERSSEFWFGIVEIRCARKLPTWFTSNESLEDLEAFLGYQYFGPVTRRIMDMCHQVFIPFESQQQELI